MRSPFPNFLRADRLALAAVLVVSGGCGSDDSQVDSGDSVTTDADLAAFTEPDVVLRGPQGNVGQFVVECTFDQFLPDDPIVFPGQPGASHLHQYFGGSGVNANSSYDDVLASETTCLQKADTASYWAPVLIDADQEPVEPLGSVAYYRAGPGVDPKVVEAFPADMMMVAGDHTATEPQPLSIVSWTCSTGSIRQATPPDCEGAPSLRMFVTFQDCWDGENTRSPIVPEPDMHVLYSSAGECPASHPVHIPQLQFAVDYPPVSPDGLMLASGNILTGHADFWNVWDQTKLEREVAQCIHRDLACGVVG